MVTAITSEKRTFWCTSTIDLFTKIHVYENIHSPACFAHGTDYFFNGLVSREVKDLKTPDLIRISDEPSNPHNYSRNTPSEFLDVIYR